jgi:hypothetical protein
MYYRCQGMRDKETRLAEILNVVTVGQCIVFVHTREAVRLTHFRPRPLPNPRFRPRPHPRRNRDRELKPRPHPSAPTPDPTHLIPHPSPLTMSRWTSLLRC